MGGNGKKKDPVIRALNIGSGFVSFCSTLLAIVLILYSGYVLYDNLAIEVSAFSSNSDVLKYKPSAMAQPDSPSLSEINPDYRAWITVHAKTGQPASPIDYPIVQGKDDLYYASRDVYGKMSLTGAIYLAAGNKPDFSHSYNLLYGHHMDNGAMFGSLDKFRDKDYFEGHKTATVTGKDGTIYDVTFFALATTDAYEDQIYTVGDRMKEVRSFLTGDRDHDTGLGTTVLHYDRSAAAGMTKMIALSTCVGTDTNGRLVLFGKMVARGKKTGGGDTPTATPAPETVKLTVKYQSEGRTVFPEKVFILTPGDEYYVVSPRYPGYDVDIQIVQGTITEDTTVIVHYIPKAWKLQIRYIYLDGTEAAPTYEALVRTGTEYDVVSPLIPGFKTLMLRVTGVNPGRDEQYTVIYIPEDQEFGSLPKPLDLGGTVMQKGVCVE